MHAWYLKLMEASNDSGKKIIDGKKGSLMRLLE